MPLTTILATDLVTNSRVVINNNFTYLDTKTVLTNSLVAATGNEVAFTLNYTTNKATSGNDTGLQINFTDTLSPGMSKPFQVNVGGVPKATIDNSGNLSLTGFSFTEGFIGTFIAGLNGVYFLPQDIAISRTSPGLLQINNSVAGIWAGLDTGLINMKSLATPSAPVITMGGTTGATTYSYTIAALLADGTTTTAASSAGSTTTGNATLTATEYNIITWSVVTGATSYNVFRTVGGVTQGKIISTTTAVTGNDTGLAASGAAPTANATGSLLWATDGEGSIGVEDGSRPYNIYSANNISAFNQSCAQSFQVGSNGYITNGGASGFFEFINIAGTGPIRLNFGANTNSAPAIANGTINGFAIQSAAGTSTFNDAVTAGSGVVAQRHIVFIDTPTLTATNASVTYTQTCALHLGLPAASTNITFTNPAKSLLCDGPVDASKYYVGGVVGYNGTITLLGLTNITVAYGIITGAS